MTVEIEGRTIVEQRPSGKSISIWCDESDEIDFKDRAARKVGHEGFLFSFVAVGHFLANECEKMPREFNDLRIKILSTVSPS
jgi:hypothetical protein